MREGFKPGEVQILFSARRSGKSIMAAAARLASLLGNLTIHDRRAIVSALEEGDRAGLNGNMQAQADTSKLLMARCMSALANIPPGVRERIASEPSLPQGCALIEQEDLQQLRMLSQRLQGGSDKMRDEGHKLWLILNRIEGK